MKLPPMPALMSRLKKFNGLPVPFTVFWKDGAPDFRIIDEQRKRQCLENRLCGICGQRINGPLAFIGGESSITHRLFIDPPMHSACARWAAQVCPYLSNGDARHRTELSPKLAGDVTSASLVSVVRPKKMGLYLTDSYRFGRLEGSTDQHVYIYVGPPRKIDWKIMPESK
jgi:hypothetical protein